MSNVMCQEGLVPMREGDLEGTLLAVLGKSGGADLLQEAAEFSLDALLDDGAVKDIEAPRVSRRPVGLSQTVTA